MTSVTLPMLASRSPYRRDQHPGRAGSAVPGKMAAQTHDVHGRRTGPHQDRGNMENRVVMVALAGAAVGGLIVGALVGAFGGGPGTAPHTQIPQSTAAAQARGAGTFT